MSASKLIRFLLWREQSEPFHLRIYPYSYCLHCFLLTFLRELDCALFCWAAPISRIRGMDLCGLNLSIIALDFGDTEFMGPLPDESPDPENKLVSTVDMFKSLPTEYGAICGILPVFMPSYLSAIRESSDGPHSVESSESSPSNAPLPRTSKHAFRPATAESTLPMSLLAAVSPSALVASLNNP